ncbi:DUF4139 domain-containing protein [Aquincola sp. S2]|uniref:DUF4139 domain-containing protein n=1 Tax=Pseudaquabacterium terrae TaxID=2732868 RepID=A0ABX2E9X9_9BURK|nr:DUF4139 domain-containing protein [Aquabacterium terrae]NRF65497.1 DUF4139 domain-containing protein [Aquabacterium terrae]
MPTASTLPFALGALAALAIALPAAGAVPERRSTLDDQQSIAVTIYNENLALVKDVRSVVLDAGANSLALRDVSAQMQPKTALLRGLTFPGGFELLEQNFDFDLLTPAKLLEKYVGRKVGIVRIHPTTGAETVESAQVLSAAQGLVLKIGERIETGAPGRIVFDGVPPNLRDRPTLVTQLQNKRPGAQTVELSYLTGGLSWQADYVAELSADDATLDLNGWVSLTNRSGTSYPNARLRLVAGDVNRVREELRVAKDAMRQVAAAPAATGMAQESLFEYHLYTLGRATTIADNQTKQVALLSAAGVPVRKELLLSGLGHYYSDSVGEIGKKLKVGVFVEFANRESARLGLPLPKGVVRVYKRDSGGHAQFIGEDRIDHTPKNETVRLKLGDAFDVTADKGQTDFKRREPTNKASYVFESAYEIVLRNAKAESVEVTVREPVPGDWTMLQESHRHAKVAAGTADWKISVPAGGSTTLKYRVLVRY